MDENMMTGDMKVFMDAVKSLTEIDEQSLTDEAMNAIIEQMEDNMSPLTVSQSINQIVQNFELQGATREEAKDAIQAVKEFINEMIYGENQYTGNKKKLIERVLSNTFGIFDKVIEKYHNYSIELPMTVDVAGGAKVPTFAHETDAAADLYAMEDQVITHNSYGNKIRTGVKIQLPEGWLAMILPRSSMGTKTPLRLSNSVGLIDSGYRGELGVLYDNTSTEDYTIKAGDRIAQLLVMPSYRFQAKVVDILADSDRGETGFGDSGK